MAKVARFCRARQALSHKSETVPQIGVVFSKTSLYSTVNKLFGGWGAAVDPARGIIDALVESGYSVDVIPEWKLDEAARQYPCIVLPDWPNSGEAVGRSLLAYARAGGKLLIAGAENAALFAGSLGVKLGKPAARQAAFVAGDEVFANVTGNWRSVEPAGAQVIESRYPAFDGSRDAECAATLARLGAGEIAAIYGPLGSVFAAAHATAARQFLNRVVRRLFTPMVEVDGPPVLEVVLRRKQGKLLVHLLNACAMQVAGDYAVTDFIPPVGPLEVRLRLGRKPARVTLEPEGRVLPGEWREGTWTGRIERLELHGILAVG